MMMTPTFSTAELLTLTAIFTGIPWLIAQPATHWNPRLAARKDKLIYRGFTLALFLAISAAAVFGPALAAIPLLLLALGTAVLLTVKAYRLNRRIRRLNKRATAQIG
jgi:uncharacterized membrane protein